MMQISTTPGNMTENEIFQNGTASNEGATNHMSTDEWVQVVFVIFGTVSIIANIISVVALRKTKKIPYPSKYLTSWLLVIDCVYIVTSGCRMFVKEPWINLNVYVFSQLALQWSYLTLSMMAIERLVLFKWPYVYLRVCNNAVVRKLTRIVWAANTVVFLMVRYLGCYLNYLSTSIFSEPTKCKHFLFGYYAILLLLIVIVCIATYYNIFRIVQLTKKGSHLSSKQSIVKTAKEIRGYEVTSGALLFMCPVLLGVVTCILAVILRITRVIELSELFACIDLVLLLNCLINPYLYVFWFRESRLELLKLFCSRNEASRVKIEHMRIEIFDIVTSEHAIRRMQSPTAMT